MSYSFRWVVGKRVLLCTFEEDLTVSQIKALIGDIKVQVQAGDAPMFIIYDARQLGKFPTDLKAIRDISEPSSKSVMWSVLIYSYLTQRFIANMAAQLLGNRLRTVTSSEACIHFLLASDPSLYPYMHDLDAALGIGSDSRDSDTVDSN